jgi:hypothetical protein
MNFSKEDIALSLSVLSLLVSLGFGMVAIALTAAFLLGAFAKQQ